MNIKSCAFSGHRVLQSDFDIKLLENGVCDLIKRGTQVFYCGMAKGFDLIAAETVLKYKKEGIKLIACVPYEGQEDSMNKTDKLRYKDILSFCDEKVVFAPHYNFRCMYARNRYMVENCDVLVSYLRKESGGTYYTVNYAKTCDKKVIEI